MNTDNNKEVDTHVSVCANCGKEGDDVNNICNKCKQVKYCNAVCKKIHKKKHKKECEEHLRLAAESAAKLHDEKLFRQPPLEEDCPICFERMPYLNTGWRYQACCGKVICSGCVYAPRYDNQGNKVDNQKCAFCRTLPPDSQEGLMKSVMKRVEADDAEAIFNVGMYYSRGMNGYPQSYTKALTLYHRAAELGSADAYCSIGSVYYNGEGVEINLERANHYYELAAMGGEVMARYNLGVVEENAGNVVRALKHFMIAVRSGHANSLNMIKEMYSKEYATKEDYMKALQSYQTYLGEIKSKQRDEAAAADEKYRYY